MTGEIRVRRASPHDPAALRLLQASDDYMTALYPPESNHLEPADALAQPQVAFFGAYEGDTLVGCGAVKRMDNDGLYGEIKRVFVDPGVRGRGVARLLMQAIESHAREARLPLLRLETGISQPEALSLYERLGYVRRAPFGSYRVDPLSLFMEKALN